MSKETDLMWKQVLIGCGGVFALVTAASAHGSTITTSGVVAAAPAAVLVVPGDVVALKSGGPRMTVERIAANGYVYCVWFKDNERQSASFAISDLVTYAHRAGGMIVVGR